MADPVVYTISAGVVTQIVSSANGVVISTLRGWLEDE
jgi:hypothetical protein